MTRLTFNVFMRICCVDEKEFEYSPEAHLSQNRLNLPDYPSATITTQPFVLAIIARTKLIEMGDQAQLAEVTEPASALEACTSTYFICQHIGQPHAIATLKGGHPRPSRIYVSE